MAKPINLYQGQAPSAFGQMGAGIAEAGAGIAKAMQSGTAQMGAGLAGGINTAVGEYVKYKDMKSAVTASEKAYETLRSYLPKELQFAIDSQLESMGSDTGISLNDKKHFWEQSNAMLGAAVKQAMDIQKQQLSDAAARDRAVIGGQTQFDLEQLRQKYKAQQGSGVNSGMDSISGGDGNSSSYYNSRFGE